MQTKPRILVAALLAAGLTFSGIAFSNTAAAQEVGDSIETDASAEPAVEVTPSTDTETQTQVELASDHPAATNAIVVAPHIGVLFPQLTSDLSTWPIFGLSAGYILPTDIAGFERPIELGLDLMYTQPGADGSGSDPNLGDADQPGDYDWELTQRMLILELYALWRFMPPGDFISAYGLIGPRAYFMESEMTATGNDGQDFGTNTQTNDEYGLVVGGGADFAVGPGTIYGTLEFGWSDLDQRITGDSNTGALTIDAGYRLYF
jgi:hypothetical protein